MKTHGKSLRHRHLSLNPLSAFALSKKEMCNSFLVSQGAPPVVTAVLGFVVYISLTVW